MTFKKITEQKRRWRFLPFNVLIDVVDILNAGSDEYGEYNWQTCEDWDDYFDALMRHLTAWRIGEKHDQKSGKHHLAHVICNCSFLIWNDERDKR